MSDQVTEVRQIISSAFEQAEGQGATTETDEDEYHRQTPEQARADAVADLVGLGRVRLTLASELAKLDARLRPRVENALAAGVSYRRIEELTGYSRSALSRWARELGKSHQEEAQDGAHA